MDSLDECNVTTRVLIRGRQRGQREREREWKIATLLALKMEERTTGQGMQAVSRS